ncbi:MAG: hypothetical protein HXS41_06175 [Theionarchaea archaeon]|nr:hypothetical protein [Theionarchaea archaeon]MBU7000342.1 hypothetical protein [Theionarchaea archaeon]MBU7020625.1 hypothetical protein [Theionarchaea archaeon]MBU7035194.1 hypothetical protein [Theionarchaea archaeon]MBU7040436.1 hypothetical protein [Theionarchaea archaeon]
MDEKKFRVFMEKNNADEKTIERSIALIKEFDGFLKERGTTVDRASAKDFYRYSAHLVEQGKNTLETYLSILRYGIFANSALYVAAMEVLDGREVMENLSRRLTDEFGEDMRTRIFEEISLPQLGISPDEKPEYTKKILPRLERALGVERCRQFLNKGLRDRYEQWRKPDREKFLKSKNIDEFLKNKRSEYIQELEKHFEEGSLYFTQEITGPVLEFIKNDPYIEGGVRKGDVLIVRKVPHMAKEYLRETDEQKKRYYYCHCPWVKDALLKSSQPVSPVFCNCSAGYYRAYWEIVLDQPIEVDVTKSILSGDLICEFAVHLPREVVEAAEKSE